MLAAWKMIGRKIKYFRMEDLCFNELKPKDLSSIEGGAWLADFVEWLVCDCTWSYPAEAYHNANMTKGI
jgi:hypothetical protein